MFNIIIFTKLFSEEAILRGACALTSLASYSFFPIYMYIYMYMYYVYVTIHVQSKNLQYKHFIIDIQSSEWDVQFKLMFVL